MARYLYSELAGLVAARLRCAENDNHEWHDRHMEKADALVDAHLPSGSGFDCGTKLDWERSTGEKLVFVTAFHRIDANGFYDGLTEHVVTVTASLAFGFRMRISGRNERDIKEYIGDMFAEALRTEVI